MDRPSWDDYFKQEKYAAIQAEFRRTIQDKTVQITYIARTYDNEHYISRAAVLKKQSLQNKDIVLFTMEY